jgi:hypothetical protein
MHPIGQGEGYIVVVDNVVVSSLRICEKRKIEMMMFLL